MAKADIDKNSKDINRLYSNAELNTRKQFLDHVEKWLAHHTTQNDDDLTGLAVLLADGVIDFTQIDHDDLEAFPGIRDGLSKAFNFASKQFELYDQRLDSLPLSLPRISRTSIFRLSPIKMLSAIT